MPGKTNFPYAAIAACIAAGVFSLFAKDAPKPPANAGSEEYYRWEDAVKFVDSLPFHQRFVDSLKKAYNVTFPAAPLRIEPDRTFFKAETLVYDIGWGPFKAGYVVLTATEDPVAHTIKLGGKGLSNGFVTTFYRMRDYVISTVDARGLYPLFFEQHLREGKKYRRDGWILFDHTQSVIHVKDRKVKTIKSPPFVNDYLSILHLARAKKLIPGDTVSLPMYADGKIHSLAIICKARQMITLDGVKSSTLLIEPRLVGDKGAFNKKDQLSLWLSDDSLRIPLQIKSKISIGAITARLLYVNKPGFINAPLPPKADTAAKKKDSTRNLDTVKKTDSARADNAFRSQDTLKAADSARGRDTVSLRTTPVAPADSAKKTINDATKLPSAPIKPDSTKKACR